MNNLSVDWHGQAESIARARSCVSRLVVSRNSLSACKLLLYVATFISGLAVAMSLLREIPGNRLMMQFVSRLPETKLVGAQNQAAALPVGSSGPGREGRTSPSCCEQPVNYPALGMSGKPRHFIAISSLTNGY